MVLRLQLRLSSFPLTRMLKALQAIGNSEGLENGTNLKVSTSLIPSYNHFNEHHINNEDWELQNLNITYYVYELYDKQSCFQSTSLDYQGLMASQHGRQNRTTHFGGKGMVGSVGLGHAFTTTSPTSIEPISLCLSSNGPTRFSLSNRQQLDPSQLPHMSATAFLQKVAQVGAVVPNSSLFRRFGLGYLSLSTASKNL